MTANRTPLNSGPLCNSPALIDLATADCSEHPLYDKLLVALWPPVVLSSGEFRKHYRGNTKRLASIDKFLPITDTPAMPFGSLPFQHFMHP
jgi:hypothetical protein